MKRRCQSSTTITPEMPLTSSTTTEIFKSKTLPVSATRDASRPSVNCEILLQRTHYERKPASNTWKDKSICLAAVEKGTQSECKQHCPWYNAIAQHKARWQKCETEEKGRREAEDDEDQQQEQQQQPTEIDALANQPNNMKDLRIKKLTLKLESARSAIDVMFKIWIPLAVVVPVLLTSFGFSCLMKWKTGKMYNTGGANGSQMALRSQTPSWV